MKKVLLYTMLLSTMFFTGCTEKNILTVQQEIGRWVIYFAYILPVILALVFHFEIKKIKWYFSVLLLFALHIFYILILYLIFPITLKELLLIIY